MWLSSSGPMRMSSCGENSESRLPYRASCEGGDEGEGEGAGEDWVRGTGWG